MEKWKVIELYPKYEVSSFGRIRNVKTKYVLKFYKNNGYLVVNLMKDKKARRKLVHRLVAIEFIENKANKNTVNHIDGNKENNHIENLEWLTQKENIQHAYKNNLSKVRVCPITQYNLEKEILRHFNSIKEVETEFGYDRSAIIRVCKGRSKTAYGYIWKYTNDPSPKIITKFDGRVYESYDNYLISSDGKVYSKKSKKILKPIVNSNNHCYVTFSVKGKKKNFYVHTLVARLYLSNPNNYSTVIHINGDKSDNSSKNLKWVKFYNQKL